jgi:lipid II:glycine glycyltransferase (peptidoglycan interpeptide bridge formation enzyme)
VIAVDSKITSSVDEVDEFEWSALLRQFDDASIYQTWAYGAVSWDRKNLSHILLRQGTEVIGMAQLRIARLPLFPTGIAYLRWGPLYRRPGLAADCETLRCLLEAIKNEYACRRRLLIRILPNCFQNDARASDFQRVCNELGFNADQGHAPYRTIRVSLELPLEQIRKRLDQKWRNQLNAAGRNGLNVIVGTGNDLFQRFVGVYRDLMDRKQFETTVDIHKFARMQEFLPEPQKMLVLLCEKEGRLTAGLVGASLGKTGIYLLGATSSEGMKAKGSYFLQWRMMELLKERGCQWYDLGGINPDRNPGVYHFKSGFGGEEVLQLPRFHFSDSWASSTMLRWGERLQSAFRPARRVPKTPQLAPTS